MILTGRCISPGVFEGRARVLDSSAWLEAASGVALDRPSEQEVERLSAALSQACVQLERVQGQLIARGQREDAEIFVAHLAMMRDPIFFDRIEQAIREEGLSAEAAVARMTAGLHQLYASSGVAMVADKAADLLDIGHRLVRCLDLRVELVDLEGTSSVLVAAVLTPSELVRFAQVGPCAALTQACGDRAHVAILARSLGIPLLTGIEEVVKRVPEGALVLGDAASERVVVTPEPEDRVDVERIRSLILKESRDLPTPRQPTTRDGVAVHLALNISSATEARLVGRLGAVGVGLFRTEFLYMGRRSWPDEQACLDDLRQTSDALGEGELHIRFADFGADKCPDYADFPVGRNPSLGARGVRLLLERDDILGPQARALAQLARERPLVALIPMLDTLETLDRLVERLAALCGVEADALPFALGAMVEVPAAALSIDAILERVAMASIGLNDLTQYVMAADREEQCVTAYHDALQPAVLRLVRQVVAAGEARDKPIWVCGELAGDPALTGALLALGVRCLSVSQNDYARVAELIEGIWAARLDDIREDLLAARTGTEVRRVLEMSSS